MNLTLALLLASTAPASPSLPNLDFGTGRLTHWEGAGFTVGPADGPGASRGVSSRDGDKRGRTALLHRTFTVPANAIALHFLAAAVRPDGTAPGGALDVVLEAAKREMVPRYVSTSTGWRRNTELLPPLGGKERDYHWPVAAHAGRRVRIALLDEDARPGCHLRCSGFRFVTADDQNAREFVDHMRRLRAAHKLAPMARHDSKHFLAIGNVPAGQVEYRLHNCETIYALFFDHFRRRGFAVREPGEKMMVALFDTQAGFEAHAGQRLSSAITGLYHRGSNRLLVYDYGTNRDFAAQKKASDALVKRGRTDLERAHLVTLVGRHFDDRRNDVNISTVMHEVAHQLSFNGGLLNRQGDAPAWLVEGLACYCEPTINGSWQGLGEPNPMRARALAGPASGRGTFIPLRDLVRNDDWLRKATRADQVLLGYAQSWALFGMLMKERPRELKRYLEMIHARRAPDHRLTDFGACFGADLAKLERRYQAYVREVVRAQVR